MIERLHRWWEENMCHQTIIRTAVYSFSKVITSGIGRHVGRKPPGTILRSIIAGSSDFCLALSSQSL